MGVFCCGAFCAQNVTLENAWVFAPEEAIADSVKAFLAFEAALLEPIPKPERAKFTLTNISGARIARAHDRRLPCMQPCTVACALNATRTGHITDLTSFACVCLSWHRT